MKWRCRDVAFQHGSSCTTKSVVCRSDNREAGSAGSASPGSGAMNDGVQGPISSRRMDIYQSSLCALADTWAIREILQIRVCTRFTQGAMACVRTFLEDIGILSIEGLQWDAHKLQEQIYRALFWLSYRCSSVYARRTPQSGEGLWGLVTKVSAPSMIPIPSILAVHCYLAWCFRVPLQRVASDIVGLRRQLWAFSIRFV